MSELSNLTRKRLEQYTVGLQNMNAEQRELLTAKEKELTELREQIADNHQRAEEIIAARERQIERLREEVKEEHELYIESCKNTAIQKSVRHKLEQENAKLREQNKTFRAAQKACVDCEGMSDEEFLECKKDRELLDFADELHNEWSFYDHNGYRCSYEGTLRQALRQAIRHSQENGGEG